MSLELNNTPREEIKAYWGLLGSLLFIYLLAPFLGMSQHLNIVAEISFLFILLFCVWLVSHDTRFIVFATCMAIPLILANLTHVSENADTALTYYVIYASGFAFFIFITGLLCGKVLRARSVNTGILVGSVCIYLLFGVSFAFLYGLIETAWPAAFSQVVGQDNLLGGYLYFSMVTLTTLGYGDISPLNPVARSFATFQALIGQLYLTILVARLVSLYSSQQAG